jgi:predicted O-methyltransferase YrrM
LTLPAADLGRVRATRAALGTRGPSRPRSAGDFERISIPASDADALRDALIAEGAGRVIEIGLAYGSSALAIAEALVLGGRDDARHLIIDPYQETFNACGREVLTAAGLWGLATLIEEPSHLALAHLVGDGVSLDAAFVDGSHLFHNVFVDLTYLRLLVKPGGLVLMDDCDWMSVADAVDYFVVNAGWSTAEVPGSSRLRSFRLPDPPFEPAFEQFRPFGHGSGRRSG